jgi:hypothetical protein
MIVPAAHAQGMAVLASLNLHEPGWVSVNSEWGIAKVNRTDQRLQLIGHVDVLHPDYQRMVGEVAQDLLLTDIDGLVIGARKSKGFAEEWSPTSRRMFEGLFEPSSRSQVRRSHRTHGVGPDGRQGRILGLLHNSPGSCDRCDRHFWLPWSCMSVRSSRLWMP